MLIEKLVRKNILALTPYASARSEYQGKAEIFMDANENPNETGFNRYPDPLQLVLKEKISQLKEIPVSQIFLGNGSDEAIDLLIRIFCEPGQDHIMILPPTYGMYRVCASISNVEVMEIPLAPNFQPDEDAIIGKANERSKLLFICSPNNPTGNSIEPGKIDNLIQEFPGVVVVDEAYIDFADQRSCTGLLKKYDNLVVLQTFSKAWGLAGIRLGMAFAGPYIIDLLNKVKPPYNINILTQNAALNTLENAEEIKRSTCAILRQREWLQKKLSAFTFVEKIYPSEANFLLVKVHDPENLYQHLITRGLIVRNRSNIVLCTGCLRITIGTAEENARLVKYLANYQ